MVRAAYTPGEQRVAGKQLRHANLRLFRTAHFGKAALSIALSRVIGLAGWCCAIPCAFPVLIGQRNLAGIVRSEERRVGKECRFGGETYHQTKKKGGIYNDDLH